MALKTCNKCGSANEEQYRYCGRCGAPLEMGRRERNAGPFESGRMLVVDALQHERLEEICTFLDRQLQAGAQRLAGPGRRKAHQQLGAWFEQVRSRVTQPGAAAETASRGGDEPPGAEPVLSCMRCGVGNRPHGLFCRSCGASLAVPGLGPSLAVTAGRASDVGRKREINEDRAEIWKGEFDGTPAWLCALADGMGGEQAGEVASRMAMEVLAERWRPVAAGEPRAGEAEFLAESVREANRRIYAAARSDASRRGMGTTETVLLLRGGSSGLVTVAHVGDSRAYLVDAQGRVNRMTQDHSLVAALVAIGQVTAEEALTHEQRSVLYRCVGHEASVEVDVSTRRVEPGDRLLLCSDGLTLHVTDAEIAGLLRGEGTPAQICHRLVALANDRGGEDNASAIVLAIEDKNRTDCGPQGQGTGA